MHKQAASLQAAPHLMPSSGAYAAVMQLHLGVQVWYRHNRPFVNVYHIFQALKFYCLPCSE